MSQANIADPREFGQIRGMPHRTPSLETREEVMFFDTDCGQVVHNIAYLRMIETCRTRLAAYKVPKRIVAVDDLPRSLIGKVLRKQVRERLLAERDAA